MPDDQELRIIISLQDLTRLGLRTLQRGIRGFQRTVDLASNAVFSLKGAVAGIGIGVLSKQFLNAATTAESYRVRLKVLTGSLAEGNKLFKEMADYASTVSFQYEEIMGAATSLTGVLEGGSREVTKWIPLIGDLAAASGLGIQETTQQVIRMYSAGAASADLFRERGILAMLGFQAGVSYSADETRKRLIEAWEDPVSRFRGASTELAGTWEGMLSMMQDRWFQFRNLVMEAGVFDFIKAAANLFLETLQDLQQEGRLEEFARNLADKVIIALETIAKGVALVGDAWRGWRLIINGLIALFGTFAEYLNRGFLVFHEGIDSVLTALENRIHDIARLIEAVDFTGMTSGITEQLKNTDLLSRTYDGIISQLESSSEFWRGVSEEAAKTVEEISVQESYLSRVTRVLDKVKAKAAEYRQEAEKAADATGAPVQRAEPQASPAERLKAEIIELKATGERELSELKILYNKGEIELSAFFDKRIEILTQAYTKEAELLKIQAEQQTTPGKKLAVQAQAIAVEQKYQQQLLTLNQERIDEQKKQDQLAHEKELAFRNLKQRELVGTVGAGLESQFQQELLALDEKHAEELIRLEKFKNDQALIEETYRVQQLEKDKLLTAQRRKLQETILTATVNVLGRTAEAFKQLYESTGEKHKEFFRVYKAAAIAQAVIDTYQSAISAYKSMAGIPYVGPALGIVAAAAAIAAGTARVAVIRQQGFAEGGEIKGHSPHSKSDNIRINATAGEYIQPVKAVQHYGLGAMEAIRTMSVPKQIFSGYSPPNVSNAISRTHFQAGGQVVPTGKTGTEIPDTTEQIVLNNINVVDPQMMGQHLDSIAGQRQVVNVISQNADQVRNALFNQQTG